MLAAGFASFFTGVTEPIEFAFMFVAPGLYLLHAVLTGVSVFLAASLNWMAGFGFSAGLVDFVLSLRNPNANSPVMLLVLGVVFFVIYYLVFTFVINKFNIKTPGREDEELAEVAVDSGVNTHTAVAVALLPLLGGKENLVNIDNCTTRLRLEVVDSSKVNDAGIKKIAAGIIKKVVLYK